MSETAKQSEVEDNYKQVQIGPKTQRIPEDWEIIRLNDDKYVRRTMGGTPDTSVDEYWDGEIPWMRSGDIHQRYIREVEGRITEEGKRASRAELIPKHSVLIGLNGQGKTKGTVGINEIPLTTNQSVGAYVVNHDELDYRYLYFSLDAKYARLRALAGGGRSGLNLTLLGQVKVPYPPLPEQNRIADVLSTVDKQIQQTDEIIQETEALRRGIVHDFIHEHEKRDTSVERFGPFELEIPMAWDTKTIESVCDYRQLGTDDRTDPDGNPVSLIKMGNLTIGSWDFSEIEKMNRNDELMKKYQLREGDLLFNTRNSPELVGKTAVWNADFPAVFDNNLMRLRFTDDIYSSIFVNIILSSGFGRRYLSSFVHGTTSVAAIYWKDLATLRMPLPPMEEQIEIVESVSAADRKLNKERETKQKFQDLKRGLMQDLLTGKVRVNTD